MRCVKVSIGIVDDAKQRKEFVPAVLLRMMPRATIIVLILENQVV